MSIISTVLLVQAVIRLFLNDKNAGVKQYFMQWVQLQTIILDRALGRVQGRMEKIQKRLLPTG